MFNAITSLINVTRAQAAPYERFTCPVKGVQSCAAWCKPGCDCEARRRQARKFEQMVGGVAPGQLAD
jgi:hypothetical protein